MAINNFKPFALDPNANVTSQADWEALPALLSGFTAGKASSAQVNKAIRQASFIAAALAQYTANKSGLDVLDDGDLNGFISKMGTAFGKDFQALDATLSALAGLATGANKLPYFTGNDTAAQTDLTSVGRDIIGKNTIADILTYLGLNLFIQSASSTRVISPGKVLSLVITNDNWGVYKEGLNVRVPLSIAAGGTGGGTQAQARDNLGIPELVESAISALVDSAPASLNTLKKLALAIGNDAGFSKTMSTALASKASGDLFYDVDERVGMRTRDKNFLISVGTDGTMGFWSEDKQKFVFWVDSDGKLLNGTIPAARVTGLSEIGVGQSWKDMASQRAFNTVYTNSTGKPISVSVTGRNQTQQSYTELWVGSVKVSSNYKESNSDSAVSAIIPAGANYKVMATGGTLLNWAELS